MSLLKSKFDHPERATYKWTKLEFDFINEKISQALAKLGGNPTWIESARTDVRDCEAVLANLEIQQ